tara:strand:- start:1139 stop:1549 length:411 start_codon:yes stop_codon:yes gene_type:complete
MKQRKEIKKTLELILGTPLSLQVESNSEEDKLKNEFLKVIDLYEMVWKRQTEFEEQSGIDLTAYDDPFFRIIEGIIYFSFSPEAVQAILFFIYSRYDLDGKLTPFVDHNGEEFLMASADDLWEYMLYLTDQMMLNN